MRKLFLFPVLVAAILGCSNNDDMPCVTCTHEQQNTYGYCYSSSYRCSYMSVYDCNMVGGVPYSDYQSCTYNNYQSSSSSSGGGSVGEYTGGSCNAADYGTVNINGQIWMKKNWGCYAAGSKCYNNDPANCEKYGRLYDWSTAMGISSSYNSNSYNPSASTNYRGVCPTGWHIPNNAEWDRLMRSVDGSTGTSSPYDSPTAGRYLKATDGWNDCGPSGSGKSYLCEDTKGFSALPGGGGLSDGSFLNVGSYGDWWSASELYSNYAYLSFMYYNGEGAYYGLNFKDVLFSVRCLQD